MILVLAIGAVVASVFYSVATHEPEVAPVAPDVRVELCSLHTPMFVTKDEQIIGQVNGQMYVECKHWEAPKKEAPKTEPRQGGRVR